MEIKTQVLIIGGGPAGSAAAITLAQAGRDVVLVEREPGPHHKVCGEFLSQEALLYLRALGIDPGQHGAAPINAVRLAGTRWTTEAPLPFPAVSLTRRCLDELLLSRVRVSGAHVLRGNAVESLSPDNDGWRAKLSGGSGIQADAVFLATGKRDLRAYPRPAGKQRGMVGFKMYWRLRAEQNAALNGHVELLLYKAGYAGLQPVEHGVANLCCLIQAAEFQRIGGRWADLLTAMRQQCPHVEERLAGAEPLLERPLAIASIPYGFVRESSDGPWFLGDQAAVIPSFTGDGMSIALHTGMLAAQMYGAGASVREFQQSVASQVRLQVRHATTISKALIAAPRLSMLAARLWPGMLRSIAAHTRIAPQKLVLQASDADRNGMERHTVCLSGD